MPQQEKPPQWGPHKPQWRAAPACHNYTKVCAALETHIVKNKQLIQNLRVCVYVWWLPWRLRR